MTELINLFQSDAAVKLQTIVVKAFNRFLCRRPTSEPYLSGDTFRKIAIHVFEKSIDKARPTAIFNHGDIIFCETHLLEKFQRYVLPYINCKFVLISQNSDMNVSNEFLSLLNSKYLCHWFAQNNILKHHKITTIPIGLENAWLNHNGRVSAYASLRKKNIKKVPRILYGFNTQTNLLKRAAALQVLTEIRISDQVYVNPSKYRKILSRYMFVASPEGNGVDCHRTWEALYLDVVPIVIRSEFYNSLPNFPGLLLNSWGELLEYSEDDLENIYKEKIVQIKNSKMIWMGYWRDRISASIKTVL